MALIADSMARQASPPYTVSKAGVIICTQGVAKDLVPFNINGNTICSDQL